MQDCSKKTLRATEMLKKSHWFSFEMKPTALGYTRFKYLERKQLQRWFILGKGKGKESQRETDKEQEQTTTGSFTPSYGECNPVIDNTQRAHNIKANTN